MHVNKKQTLQQKHQTYLSSLQKGRPSLLCWTVGGLRIKKVKKKNAACIQTHALDLKVVEKMIACIMSIHLLTKDNHTGGYKIWYQPLKTHAGHTQLSSPRCAPQQVLITIEWFWFAHNVTFLPWAFICLCSITSPLNTGADSSNGGFTMSL